MRRTLLRLLALACLATLVSCEEAVPQGEEEGGVQDARQPTRRRGRIGHHKRNPNAGPAPPAKPYVFQPNRGMPMCRIAGCATCSREDWTVCARCSVGFALTEQKQCQVCGEGCQSCTSAGPGKCDPGQCNMGFTLDKQGSTCKTCAPHCHVCEEAGPGGCDECKNGRMLRVQREAAGEEVHECVPCGKGCRKCSMELGCIECNAFFTPMENGATCQISYWRLLQLVLGVIALLFAYFSVGSFLVGKFGSKTDAWPLRYELPVKAHKH